MYGRRRQIQWVLEHAAPLITLIADEMLNAIEYGNQERIDYLVKRIKDVENQILLAMKKSKRKETKTKLNAIYNYLLEKIEELKKAMALPED